MASQPGVGSTEPHVVNQLAEYFSGSLAPSDELVIESHLLACAACRAEYDELGDAALMLAAQPPGVLDDVTAGHERPRRARRTDLPRLAGYAAVLVAGAALGVGATVVVDRSGTPPLQNVGDSQDTSTERLSVTLVEEADGGTQVRAAAVGLRPGHGFQLIAVGDDGQGYVVTTGVADGGLQSMVGTVPIAPSDIIFVALVEDGDGALLIARPS